jgi:hypothetical protein
MPWRIIFAIRLPYTRSSTRQVGWSCRLRMNLLAVFFWRIGGWKPNHMFENFVQDILAQSLPQPHQSDALA